MQIAAFRRIMLIALPCFGPDFGHTGVCDLIPGLGLFAPRCRSVFPLPGSACHLLGPGNCSRG
jgi:hypothetical protein